MRASTTPSAISASCSSGSSARRRREPARRRIRRTSRRCRASRNAFSPRGRRRTRLGGMTDWDWDRVVFDHVKLTVGDPEASKGFYRTVLAALEIPPLWEDERGGQYANLVVVGPGEAS